MGLIREPLDVDFVVDPRPLAKKEREAISRHIKEYKAKRARAKKKLRTFSGKGTIATLCEKSAAHIRIKGNKKRRGFIG